MRVRRACWLQLTTLWTSAWILRATSSFLWTRQARARSLAQAQTAEIPEMIVDVEHEEKRWKYLTLRESFLEGTTSPSYPVEFDASNAVSKSSRRPQLEAQWDSDIKHLLEQTSSPNSVVCLRKIEEHKDGLFLICQLKAIDNELWQFEALVGVTSALAETALPRAEERLRLQPLGKAIDNESLKQFPDGGRESYRAITAHSLWVFQCL